MSNPIFRARWLAPALFLALGACGQPMAQVRLVAEQARADPPELWRVEALNAAGQPIGATLVCADRNMRAGFGRANAEVNGRTCAPMKGAVERPGLYAVRCELDGRRFGLTLSRSGDEARDFKVAFALTALDGTDVVARQVRRFQRVGACPAGWGIGDQGKPGGQPGVNALAGTWDGL